MQNSIGRIVIAVRVEFDFQRASVVTNDAG